MGWINNIAAVVQFGSVFVIIVCVLVMSDSLQSADFGERPSCTLTFDV